MESGCHRFIKSPKTRKSYRTLVPVLLFCNVLYWTFDVNVYIEDKKKCYQLFNLNLLIYLFVLSVIWVTNTKNLGYQSKPKNTNLNNPAFCQNRSTVSDFEKWRSCTLNDFLIVIRRILSISVNILSGNRTIRHTLKVSGFLQELKKTWFFTFFLLYSVLTKSSAILHSWPVAFSILYPSFSTT